MPDIILVAWFKCISPQTTKQKNTTKRISTHLQASLQISFSQNAWYITF